MQRRHFWIGLLALLLLPSLATTFHSQQSRKSLRVLIETRKPYDSVIRTIEGRGGRVTQVFTYVDGIAAEIPEDALGTISSFPGVQAISKDMDVEKPASVNPIRSRLAG